MIGKTFDKKSSQDYNKTMTETRLSDPDTHFHHKTKNNVVLFC